MLIQELIPGPDAYGVNYNAYRVGGAIVAECTARKVRQAPPGFGLPRVVRSVEVPQVVEPGRAILEALGLEGFACTEFKYDARDRTFKLLEVNGRHNLSTLLSVRSGMNFPWISYRHLTSGTLPARHAPAERLVLDRRDEEVPQSLTRAGRDARSLREIPARGCAGTCSRSSTATTRAPLLEGAARRALSGWPRALGGIAIERRAATSPAPRSPTRCARTWRRPRRSSTTR